MFLLFRLNVVDVKRNSIDELSLCRTFEQDRGNERETFHIHTKLLSIFDQWIDGQKSRLIACLVAIVIGNEY